MYACLSTESIKYESNYVQNLMNKLLTTKPKMNTGI